ncbi:MAG: non-hydrolyzing UDP-N-acetylglucosamine 2-epimerase [Acidobacteriota bacterium]
MLRILSIIGTRPEAIKMAPVVRKLRDYPGEIESVVCNTAQHREILDQVLASFGIVPDIDLDIMQPDQQLAELTGRLLTALARTLRSVKPGLVLVQGDTTTVMAAALAAFYLRIPVGHVEAGLRTSNRYNPFPEEINRRVASVVSSFHFAPTSAARDALLREGVEAGSIFVTGNTVIDALHWMVRQPASTCTATLLQSLSVTPSNRLQTILLTAHRRESFGEPFRRILLAVRTLVENNLDVQVVYPVHPNPNVQGPAHSILGNCPRVHLIPPVPYDSFVHLIRSSYLVLTDSGGIQEEAPGLGKPVLVLRNETERPEAIAAGTAKLVGDCPEKIVAHTELLLRDRSEYERMSRAVNPYGDGHAAERIVRVIRENLL